jgi:hypothetical protein
MDNEVLAAYRLGVEQGKADARRGCDICPVRTEDGLPVLVAGCDLIRRPGKQN